MRCRERWPQGARRLCRQCERETGDTRGNFERERDVLRTRVTPRHVEPEPDPPLPRPVVEAHGELFVVVWSGTDSGAAACGLPRAEDRGTQ